MLLRRLWLLALAFSFIVLGTACTADLEEGCLSGECSPPGKPNIPEAGGSPCETTPATGDFPCEVFTVLQNNCHTCHQSPPLNGAPYSLLTYEDTRALHGMTTTLRWKHMGVVVESGFMPLNQTITEPDKKILLDWVSTCALPADSMGCE